MTPRTVTVFATEPWLRHRLRALLALRAQSYAERDIPDVWETSQQLAEYSDEILRVRRRG